MAQRAFLNKKGMTLIEVLFALVILLIASLALMKMAMLGMSMNVQNALRDEAVNVVEREMNDLRAVPFDNIASAATTTIVARNFRGFTVNYTVTPGVTNITSDSKQINMSVAWSYRGQAYTHAITTMLRKQ